MLLTKGIFNYKFWFSTFGFLYILINSEHFYCSAAVPCKPSTPNSNILNISFFNRLLQPLKSTIPFPSNFQTDRDYLSLVKEYTSGLFNEDIHLNITQLLTKYGFPPEQYEVETSDGYLLTMFRIPSDGEPVFLMHGLLCSSDDWVTTGPYHGLAYLLAKAGYDVWLGNARGNKHSRKHRTLSPACAEFWDYSWDEIGRYDLPAMIDFTLNKTGKSKLAYVGHSQGATAYYVMASEKPEYTEKITVSIILSAVVYVTNTYSLLIQLLAPVSNPADLLTQTLGVYEFAPNNVITTGITTILCGTPLTATLICNNIVFIGAGYNYAQINATNLPVIYNHYPAGAAAKQIVHYGQIVNARQFQRLDMGKEKNLKAYGSETPPRYPLEKVSGKMVIFYSDNDSLATKPDLETLYSKLTNDYETYRVPFDQFTHFDFIFARDVDTLVNNKVIEYIDKYN